MMVGVLHRAVITSGTSAEKVIKPATDPRTLLYIITVTLTNPTASVANLRLLVGNNTVFRLTAPANDSRSAVALFMLSCPANTEVKMVVEGAVNTEGAVVVA